MDGDLIGDLTLGFDPGLNGGYSIFTGKQLHYFSEFPKAGKFLDYRKLRDDLRIMIAGRPSVAFFEKVASRPGQSSVATFSFGFSTGRILGIICECLELPVIEVSPQRWQKPLHIGIDGSLDAKERSLQAATKLFPKWDFRKSERSKKPHDGIIDAVLIAYYGIHHHNEGQK